MSKSSIEKSFCKHISFIILTRSIVVHYSLVNKQHSFCFNISNEIEHNQQYRVLRQEGKWNRKNRITTTAVVWVFGVHGAIFSHVPLSKYVCSYMKFTHVRMYWISSHSTFCTLKTNSNKQQTNNNQPNVVQSSESSMVQMRVPKIQIEFVLEKIFVISSGD